MISVIARKIISNFISLALRYNGSLHTSYHLLDHRLRTYTLPDTAQPYLTLQISSFSLQYTTSSSTPSPPSLALSSAASPASLPSTTLAVATGTSGHGANSSYTATNSAQRLISYYFAHQKHTTLYSR
jgi:hypothetical protein